MSATAAGYAPALYSSALAVTNATAPLPDLWGGEGWVPPVGPPPPPPTGASSSREEGSRRRRRWRRRRRAEAAGSSSWIYGGGSGDRWAGAARPWERGPNATGHNSAVADLLALNLTADEMDYVLNITNISKYSVLHWDGVDGVGHKGYPLNIGHRRNNTANVQKGGQQDSETCYCGKSESLLRRMTLAYRPLHPVAALTVCALGTLANALNVAVLTRPHLAPAPVNRILTAIAAADAALMAEYAAFAIIVCLPRAKSGSGGGAAESPTMTPAEEVAKAEREFPFAAAAFVLFHMHFSQVLHTVSICLTLTLAVWRYLALRLPPERARILCSRRRCSVALAVSVLLPPLLCSPSYLLFGITTTHVHMGNKHPVDAAHDDLSVPPNDYMLDPSVMIPTVAMTSLDVDGGSGLESTIPSVSASLRQMAWAAAPPLGVEDAAGEDEEEENDDDGWSDWSTTESALYHPSRPLPPSSPILWTTTSPRPGDETTEAPNHPPPAVAVLYHVALTDVAKDQGEMLYLVNFWVYAVILKLIPCLVLTIISVCLVRTLCRAKSRRRALQGQGDVKKASQAKSTPICRWRKNEEKVTLSTPPSKITPPAPPPAEPRREKPLDDGGVWMGREEAPTKEEEEEEEAAVVEEDVEEEAATLVQEPSSRAEEGEGPGPRCEGMASTSKWWPGWLPIRRKRKTSASDEGVCVSASQQQTDAVATVGAAVRRRRRRTERTTRMLVAVLILFLVTEFPQGVLGLMSGLLGRCFFRTCYHLSGDLMDLLALLNGSINFILYCAMSRQFRQTFAQLFCKHPKLLWTSLGKSCPFGHKTTMEMMKNGNMGGEGLRKGATTAGGQPSQSMGEVQSTYV